MNNQHKPRNLEQETESALNKAKKTENPDQKRLHYEEAFFCISEFIVQNPKN